MCLVLELEDKVFVDTISLKSVKDLESVGLFIQQDSFLSA